MIMVIICMLSIFVGTKYKDLAMQWQQMLKSGNQCFDQEQWLQAEYFYKEAYAELDKQWHQTPKQTELLMAWLCASHNLSTLHEVQGELKVSLQYLKIPHLKLKEIACDDNQCDDLKLIAFKALKFTLTPLLSFAKKYPTCRDCMDDLVKLKQQLDSESVVLH